MPQTKGRPASPSRLLVISPEAHEALRTAAYERRETMCAIASRLIVVGLARSKPKGRARATA